MTEAQKDSLIKDMNSLNLTKYISEAVSPICFYFVNKVKHRYSEHG